MKNKLFYWWVVIALVLLGLPATAWAADSPVGVSYRGHIQDRGDYPTDGSWVDSPEIIGTTGQSKRIEGFEIKLTGAVPAGMELRYNVHVQNKGWLYDENDATDWPKNGEYAGTRGESLRIEAVKIVLTDSAGKPVTGYSVAYRGHVQNVGDLPADKNQWLTDGDQLGTVGSSLRLEALLVQVVKTGTDPAPPAEPVVYDAAGSYGPAVGTETIDGNVTVAADGVTLQNLVIKGDLTIAEAVGNGTVTLNNVTVVGDTFVRGGGANSIHINGGQYSRIVMEKTATGQVRIVATDVTGLDVVIAEDATGETIILEGAFDSVEVNASNMTVTTQGNTTTIGKMTVGEAGAGSTVTLNSGTTVSDLVLDGQAAIKGQGTVAKAEVKADGVIFDKQPGGYTVEPGVVIPPVFPSDSGGGTPSKTTLTISAPTLTDAKVYDGNTSAVVTAGTLSGVATADAGNVTVTAAASYDNKKVGSGNKTIRVSYTLGGTAAAKYNKPADFVINTGTITAKALTIANPTLTTVKEYDGNVTAAVTAGVLNNAVVGDSLTVTALANYNDATRATGKTITVVYTLGGGDAGNYSAPVNYQISNGEISKKQLTITGLSVVTEKVYDGKNIVGIDANWGLAGSLPNENIGITINPCYDDVKVGDRTITITYTLSGSDQGNYQAPATETMPGKITPKPLSGIGAVVTTEKVYDGGTTAAITDGGIVSGALPGEAVNAIPTANYNDKSADQNKTITVSYSLVGDPDVTKNYSAPASYTYSSTGKITAKPLTITAPNVTLNKMYDGNSNAVVSAGTLQGVVGSDVVTPSASASYSDKAVGNAHAIAVSYNLIGTDAGNYSAPANVTFTGNITKKILSYTLTTDTPSKVYDQNNVADVDAVAYSLSGIVDDEDVHVLNVTGTYDNSDVGTTHTVIIYGYLYGEAKNNYQMQTYTLHTGVITAKPLTASGVVVTTDKEYDGSTTAAVTNVGTVSGKLGSDDVSVIPTATYDTKDFGLNNKTITVSYTLDGGKKDNYSAPASYTYSSTGNITAKPLTITAPILTTTKPFDSTTSAAVTAGTLNGVATGETVNVTATANYNNSDLGINKPITVTYQISDTTNNYLKPADDSSHTGIIKKDIQVSIYNSGAQSWSNPADAAAVSVTSLPAGYTIFDLDNDGNVYARASANTIKKYSGGSWNDAFGNGGLPGGLQFAGIDVYQGTATAIGVSNGTLYENGSATGNQWNVEGTAISNPDNYQLLGGYNNAGNFYLVYHFGNVIYSYNPYESNPAMVFLGAVPILEGYSICGFNFTEGKLNMYQTK